MHPGGEAAVTGPLGIETGLTVQAIEAAHFAVARHQVDAEGGSEAAGVDWTENGRSEQDCLHLFYTQSGWGGGMVDFVSREFFREVSGKNSRENMMPGRREPGKRTSDGQYFLFFGGKDIVDSLEEFVVYFLDLGFSIFLDVLAHALLDCFFEAVNGIATCIAN